MRQFLSDRVRPYGGAIGSDAFDFAAETSGSGAIAAHPVFVEKDGVGEQHLRATFQNFCITERLRCALDRGATPASLGIDQSRAREDIRQSVLGVRDAQISQGRLKAAIVVFDGVVAQTENGARKWLFAALAQL